MTKETPAHIKEEMQKTKICILIPTYNNEKTIEQVVSSTMNYCKDIIVVNDGSTDNTKNILEGIRDKITLITYPKNKGKGYAIKQGFQKAREKGFDATITMDSDGQHLAEDIPLLLNAYSNNPNSLIIGQRSFNNPNMPNKNSFANRFSNFWFKLQTGKKLNDTQTGFRLYPIKKMKRMKPFNNRYEAEYELLVRIAWRNIKLIEQPINVYYPPLEERVSHFRPTKDFVRISLLNTFLTIAALFYGYFSMLIRKK
ncbi:MAG: glycosyltransferase family 2 protein [Bacteroidales bacterium]|jgi:glycosyltransferase involved in cell wall biosynthesis|nr:glycosyltransferase family 2 protein [Bacteroidales bacterium]